MAWIILVALAIVFAVASRSGGNWSPRWPRLGQELTLFRLRDQVLARGTIYSLMTMPRSATARIELEADLYVSTDAAVEDPSIFLRWLVGAGSTARGGGMVRLRSGNEIPEAAAGGPWGASLESI